MRIKKYRKLWNEYSEWVYDIVNNNNDFIVPFNLIHIKKVDNNKQEINRIKKIYRRTKI